MNVAVVVLDFEGLGCNMEQDHAEPSPIVPSRWIRIIPILILHAASLMLVSVVLCNVAPGVQEYYRQANIEIPEATLNIAWLSDRVIVYWLPIFFAIMVADFLFMFVLTSLKFSKHWPLSAYSQIFVFLLLLFAVYVTGWLAYPINW